MPVIVGSVRLPPENIERARPAMARMIAASRAEPGCRLYAYAEDVLDPGLVRVIEAWEDRASLERHLASGHIAEWRAAWPALGLHGRDLALHEAGAAERT